MPRHITKTSFKAGKRHVNWKGGCYDYWHNEARKIMGCPKGLIVHHKDGNYKNNDINNLQIMTQNEHVALHNKLRKGTKKKNTLVLKSLDSVLELKKINMKVQEISEILKISYSTVKRCCLYLRKGGLI